MSVHHEHLSGWKLSGAYRIYVRDGRGSVRMYIFKDALYSDEHIPALRQLPIDPGPPEHAVYRAGASGGLASLLPTVHHVEELVPGRHYRYVLEDLTFGHRRALDVIDGSGHLLVRLASELPRLHHEMATSAVDGEFGLIRYDRRFRARTAEFVSGAMQKYARRGCTLPRRFTLALPQMISAYADQPGPDDQDLTPIHGDYHVANLFIGRDDSIRLVDWEWAGTGRPHMDLASLLKQAPPTVEREAVAAYAASEASVSPEWTRQQYEWCKLERGLIDAAFLGLQRIDSENEARFDLEGAVQTAAMRAVDAFEALERADRPTGRS